MSQRIRGYIYRVLAAAFPIAVFYGFVDPDAAPLWLAVCLAALKTPIKKDEDFTSEEVK